MLLENGADPTQMDKVGYLWIKSEFMMNVSKYLQSLQTLKGYIFRSIKYFVTKLCNFTSFKMFFLAVKI